jgi:hypothetical protein
MSWHVHEDSIEAYVSGRIGDASAFSLEAHVLACATCRGALSARVDHSRTDRIWVGIHDPIVRPRPGVVERTLTGLGIPAHIARLLVVTPAMRTAWILAVAASLAFAVLASRGIVGSPLPLLVLAPIAPLVGVVAAFGRSADPAWEIGLASPTGGFRLTLIRAASVLTASMGLSGIAALTLPEPGWSAAAWLLPSLALTALTLVLSSMAVPTHAAATVVGVLWATGVIAVERLSSQHLAAFGPTAQVVFVVLAVVSTGVLAARHGAFERPARI